MVATSQHQQRCHDQHRFLAIILLVLASVSLRADAKSSTSDRFELPIIRNKSDGRRIPVVHRHPNIIVQHDHSQTVLKISPQKHISVENDDYDDSHRQRQQQQSLVLTTIRGGASSSSGTKLSNLKERTVSSVLMLGGLVIWLDTFREKGLILLVLIIQIGLYREGTNVSQQPTVLNNKDIPTSSIKWWWFIAYDMVLVGPRLLATKRDGTSLISPTSMHLCSFFMVIAGVLSFVITLNNSMAFSYEFQLALKELAMYHLSIGFLIVPTAFWIYTIQDFGMTYVLFSLFLVMINDTMAYLFGICFGRNPLLPTISPKKTWEGFLGALGSTMGLSILLWDKMGLKEAVGGGGIGGNLNTAPLAIAAYCSLVAPFGGFLASIVKRAYGKKDFSNMIAGHGGFIDRLDCQIVTAPFMYLFLKRFVLLPGKS